MAGMADRMVEWQTEMATYVLFTVHTDDDDDNDNDTLIFYSLDKSLANVCFSLNPNFLLLRISFLFSINQHLYSHNRFSKYIET